jgi:uncharacterized membrane protein
MKQYIAVGVTVLAGAALLEAALVPGIVIGGAAVLAPSLTRLARRKLLGTAASRPPRRAAAAQTRGQELVASPRALLPRFAFGQAIAKTITYRIIVTTLDFSTNYIVIGEFATAAGLSTFNFIAGPLFYLGHEAIWNYLGTGDAVDVPVLPSAEGEEGAWGRFTVSRALAKTVTFRTLATVMDFTTNYVVVGDVASAVLLSATGFVLGPFVYYGHEKAWEHFGPQAEKKLELLPSM